MFRLPLFFVLWSSMVLAQVSGEQLAFQKAVSTPGDSAKIAELERFAAEHPNSQMIPNVYAAKFQAFVNLKKDSAAFRAIHSYLALLDPSQLVPALNAVAAEFAQRKYFIDSAAVFIDSAIALYDREEPILFNTKALVLLRQQRYAEAEKVQQKAISLLPESAVLDNRYTSFFIQLGFIRVESGAAVEGMKQIILGNLIVPKQSLPVEKIDSMLAAHSVPVHRVPEVRDSLYRSAAGDYLRLSPDSALAMSKIAVGLARNGVLTDVALMFMKESYDAAQTRTIEERSGAAAAAGLTLYHLHRYSDAEQYLSQAAAFASPMESEIFITLGDVKEQLGKKQDAFNAYLTGAVNARTAALYQKLIALKNELHPTANLDSLIVAHQSAMLQYVPEEYVRPSRTLKKNQVDRVVLAELFTGSECKPCQAADLAFDYLIERYRSSSLAILEYHLHIPMPDPMTNPDAERRAEYYGVRSTPTAIFNGTARIASGGNRMMAKSKFFLFSELIEQLGSEPTSASITMTAVNEKGKITLRGTARMPGAPKTHRLKVMLVEDEVFYRGANGVEHHKFVVRKMMTPAEGLRFNASGTLSVNQTVSLASVVAGLEQYFKTTNEQYRQMGASLKENKSAIDPNRLAVVAFIQDEDTNEVLQAVTEKVTVKLSVKGKNK